MSETTRPHSQPFDDGPRPGDDAVRGGAVDTEVSAGAESSGADAAFAAPRAEAAAPQDADAEARIADEAAFAEAGATAEDQRLTEALQRSRTIPLDGVIEVDEPNPYTATSPVPTADAADAADAGAQDTATLADAQPAAEPLAHPAPAATDAEPLDAPIEHDLRPGAEPPADAADEDVFAPLGISSSEGLLVRPDKRSNRGFGLLMTLLATIVFAGLFASAFAGARVLFTPGAGFVDTLAGFVVTAPFIVAAVVFLLVLLLWKLIANRARWWSYVLGGLVIGVLVLGAYYLGIGVQHWINTGQFAPEVVLQAMLAPEHLPGAMIAFVAARESATWIGGLTALRARKITRLNQEDLDEYERRVAQERAASGIVETEPEVEPKGRRGRARR